MKPYATGLAFAFVLCLGISHAASVDVVGPNELVIEIAPDPAQFTFDRAGGYDYVRVPGSAYLPQVGVPCLPRVPYHIAIPADSRVVSVEAVCRSETELDGIFAIAPTQPPTALGGTATAWVDGREDIYASDQLYPHSIVGGVREGFMGDNRLLSFFVSPFRWKPSSGKLFLCEAIEVRDYA